MEAITPNHRVLRASSLILVGRIAAMAMNFAIHIAIVRYLSVTSYGAFAFGLAIVGLLQTLAIMGLDRGLTRFLPTFDRREEHGRFLGLVAMVVGVTATVSALAVIAVAGLRVQTTAHLVTDAEAAALLVVLVLLVPIDAFDEILINLLAVFGDSRAIFFRRYIVAPALRLAAVTTMAVAGAGVLFLAYAYVAVSALGLAVFGFALRRHFGPRLAVARRGRIAIEMPWRLVLSYTLPLLTSDLTLVALTVVPIALLGTLGGTGEVAILGAILPFAQLNELVFASTAVMYTPSIAWHSAGNDNAAVGEAYRLSAKWMALLTFPIFAITLVAGTFLPQLLFGDQYAEASPLLPVLAGAYYFNAALGFNGVTLKVLGHVRYIAIISVVTALTSILMNLWLIPPYGAPGAAIAMSVALVTHNLLKQWGISRIAGIAAFGHEERRVYLSIILASLSLLVILMLRLAVAFSLILAAAVSLWVLRANREHLAIAEIMPNAGPIRLLLRIVLGAAR